MDHLVQIQEVRDSLAHHSRAEQPFASRLLANRHYLFGDIQNLVNHNPHTAFAVVEHNHLHRVDDQVLVLDARLQHRPQRYQGKNAVPVLHHLASASLLDDVARKLLQPGNEGERNG